MSKQTMGAIRAPGGMTNWQCRARRLALERETLAHRLHDFLIEIPDAISFDFHDLHHLAGYRILEPEGLVHAGIYRASGRLTIIAATSRMFRKPDLRIRLFALRRLATLELKKVTIATPRGLLNETGRLRKRRLDGLVVCPAPKKSDR